eukprot:6267883-Prymnesium_polylepis.1
MAVSGRGPGKCASTRMRRRESAPRAIRIRATPRPRRRACRRARSLAHAEDFCSIGDLLCIV